MITLLKDACKKNNLNLTEEAITKLHTYLLLLKEWNNVINLTSITDDFDMIMLHLIDSLAIISHLHGNRLLDVGTGAGLPGIPLAIVLPHTHWTLLDKCAKKTRFLLQMKAELALPNVEIVHVRTENFHPNERFDSIVSRAYGTLRLLTDSTKHLLANDGKWLLMKGKYPQSELDDLPSNILVQRVSPIKLIGKTLDRHLVEATYQQEK
jgi:16S rRNA (guanine527-N7)-methyltransferase